MSQQPPPPTGPGAPPHGVPWSPPTGGYGYPNGYPPPPARPVPLRTDYAHWGRRVAASVIDYLPAWVAMVPLTVAYVKFVLALSLAPMSGTDQLPDLRGLIPWAVTGGVLYLAAIGWDVYNRWLRGGRTGQSLGKRVLKLRLIGESTGEPIGALNAFARDLVHILDGVAYVGYLWPLWDEKRQTFADMLMHTIVVDERPGVRAR